MMHDVYIVPYKAQQLAFKAAIEKARGNDAEADRLMEEAKKYIEDHPEQCGVIRNVPDDVED
jgi:hypothetical protein